MSALFVVLLSSHLLAADRYTEVTGRMRALEASRLGHVFEIGRSGKGRTIEAVLISASKPSHPAETRVLVISGQHGDETSPIYAMLDLAEDMASGEDAALSAMLRDMVIVIVPVVNPDGFISSRRSSSHMADLNRTWGAGEQPEVLAVQALVDSFKPQVVLDLHEWKDRNPLHTNCVEVAGFGSGPQRKLSRLLAAFARHGAVENTGVHTGIRSVFYHKEADGRLAHRYLANHGICSMLVETASGQPRDVRMRVYRELVLAAARTLAASGDPRIGAQLAAVDHSIGTPDPKFARMCEPPRVATAGVGDISCWVVIAAATIYIAMRSLGSRNRRTGESELVLGRPSGMCIQTCRIPLTEMVRANVPLHERVALIQQQRVRPSDRGKAKAAL